MVWLLNLLSLCLLGLTAVVGPSEATLAYAGREAFELLHLYDPTTTPIPPAAASVAVSLPAGDLHDVSRSVLRAESWVRAHVLDHFPSAHITTVVVEASHLCSNDNNNNAHEDPNLGPVLHSMKNIYHSLTRWGLQKEIKVSPALSVLCFDLIRETNPELAITVMSPLLGFLSNTNSTLSLFPPSNTNFDPASDQAKRVLNSRIGSLKKHGIVLGTIRITLLAPIYGDAGAKHLTRKLSFVDFGFPDPVFPERPTPLPGAPELPPTGAPVGFSRAPAFPPPRFSLPPCDPFAGAPAPGPGKERVGQWCVAKPSVPAEALQVAMDYACGRGGADCAAIKPRGSCYFPDTVVAHASYAFNSYWQRNKKNGGSCSFGGTAMVVNSDPSFLHCRFVFS